MPPFRVVLVVLWFWFALASGKSAYGLKSAVPNCSVPLAGFPFADPSLGPPVLVADTDPHVPLLLGLALREMGFSTVVAFTDKDAEWIARERGIRGAFIAETVGPGTLELAHRLQDEWHIPVVLLGTEFLGDRMPDDGFRHLGKPFETRAVWRAASSFTHPSGE